MRKADDNGSTAGDMRMELRKAMRLFPQGVTVATTQTKEGPRGLTVSSFISVSLDPPLVLISLGKGTEIHDLFVEADSFAVNLLASDQRQLSERFAGESDLARRFEGFGFHGGTTGSPVLDGALAVVECSVWRIYEGGDHSLILGKVVRASALRNVKPLVYHAQKYVTLSDHAPSQ